ncbi:MAG: ABC transporter permease [Anaerolineales bacterium]|nr:ABC transporter permease [Anaerolineales bacterium]
MIREERGLGMPPIFRFGALLALIFLLVPMVVIVVAGLTAGGYLKFPPDGFSLRWVLAFLGLGPGSYVASTGEAGASPVFIRAFGFSFLLALSSTVCSLALGTMASLVLIRHNFPGRSFFQAFFLSPIMLPGIVIGLALFIFYRTLGLGLPRSYVGLLIGHVIVCTPFVIRTVSASLHSFDLSLEEAARSLGASALQTFRQITLPLIKPGVMAGAIFSFIISFGQFDVTVFLAIPQQQTLPLTIFDHLRFHSDPIPAAAGIFAITLVAASLLITARAGDLKAFSGFGK